MSLRNSLWLHGYIAHIDELVVDHAYRGKRIGTELLWKAMEVARQRGADRIELDSAFHRTEAHKFYVGRGFENRGYLFSAPLREERCGG